MKYFARFGTRLKPTLLLKESLLHGCFSYFQNCTNVTKSNKASHMLNEDKMLEYVEINKFRRQTMASGVWGPIFFINVKSAIA